MELIKQWDIKDHQGDAQLQGPGVFKPMFKTAQSDRAKLTAESCNYFQVSEKYQSQKNSGDLPKGLLFNQPRSLCVLI